MNRHNPISKQAVRCGIQPCSRKENDALYVRVRQGDPDAKRRMIEGNMALVIVLMAAYLHEHPYIDFLRDDLISEGFLALTKAVNQLALADVIEEPNPTGFLRESIYCSINDHAREENTIPVPARTQRHSDTCIPPYVVSIDTVDPPLTDPFQVVFLLEKIEGCCEDPLDQQIISLRLQGYRDHEIGERLQCSQQHVSHLRKRLYERFQEAA